MHMTVRAAATAIFPVKLGFRLESAKSIPVKKKMVHSKLGMTAFWFVIQ
jgi:hypothetical protein